MKDVLFLILVVFVLGFFTTCGYVRGKHDGNKEFIDLIHSYEEAALLANRENLKAQDGLRRCLTLKGYIK